MESGHCSTKVTVKQGEGLEVIFDIKLNGFSRMEEAGSEHVGHKGSYFISWVEQSSSARKGSWKNFSTRGGAEHHTAECADPLEDPQLEKSLARETI